MSDENITDEGDGIASLRKQYEATRKQNEELAKELAAFRNEKRQATISEVLKAKGLPEKAATLYSGEDFSPDAVDKWVSEYADVFGIKQEGTTAQAVDPNAANAARVSAASHGSPGTEQFTPGQPVGDPVELLHLMNTMPYEKLVELNLLPKPNKLYGRG
jgi:glutamyl/glutaminyl-tRNA synthetase